MVINEDRLQEIGELSAVLAITPGRQYEAHKAIEALLEENAVLTDSVTELRQCVKDRRFDLATVVFVGLLGVIVGVWVGLLAVVRG